MTTAERYPYMEENAGKIEELCCDGVALCSDASDILLSCSGDFAYWDTLAETGGEKHPEQFAIAIAGLLAVQDKVQKALSKAREAWRLVQENDED